MLEMAFAGGGLERAAHLRCDDTHLRTLAQTGRFSVFWRGKPLLQGQENLGWLEPTHPIVAGRPFLFLGLSGDQGLFAVDLSDWDPNTGQTPLTPVFLDPSRQTHPLLTEDFGFEDLRNKMNHLSPLDAEIAVTSKAVLQWHSSHRYCAACGAESRAVKAGWQRDCPSCKTQHFPRTDPVVIMLVERGNSVLLGRSPGWPEGMYSLLAGFMEPGETIEAAVQREVFEETGIRTNDVVILRTQPWPWPSSLMIGCKAKALNEDIKIDPAEIEDAIWVTREDLVRVFTGQHPFIKPGRKGAIAGQLMRDWLADLRR